jgi:hypothetical protein
VLHMTIWRLLREHLSVSILSTACTNLVSWGLSCKSNVLLVVPATMQYESERRSSVTLYPYISGSMLSYPVFRVSIWGIHSRSFAVEFWYTLYIENWSGIKYYFVQFCIL